VNRLYRNLMTERVRFAVASARAAAELEHAGVKGSIRETLIADLFRPLLPTDIGIATGIIISADDEQSAQQDIVFFDRRILPPLVFEGPAIIPVEAALATIEVKSLLSSTELRKAMESAAIVQRMTRRSGVQDKHGNYVDPRILDEKGERLPNPEGPPASATTSLLLALASDLTPDGKAETERYIEVCHDAPHALRGMCIIDRGFFGPTQRLIFDRPLGKYYPFDNEPNRNNWTRFVEPDGNHAELLALVGSLHGLVLSVTQSRAQPPLAAYLND
jgi:hypothetical protein